MFERSSRSRIAALVRRLRLGVAAARSRRAGTRPEPGRQHGSRSPMASKITQDRLPLTGAGHRLRLEPAGLPRARWPQRRRIGAELDQGRRHRATSTPTPVLHQLGDDGAQLIIAQAGGYSTAGVRSSRLRDNIPVIVYDRPDLLKPNLVCDIETDSQQGAYLAGVIAAHESKTGTLGIVTSADDTNWHKQAGGFVAGAQATKPDIKFSTASRSGAAGYADAPAARRAPSSVIASGADIIFGMGDGSSFGMLDAVETATPPAGADKVWFIDVIGDKSDPTVDTNGVLLSSVLWNFTPAFEDAIAQHRRRHVRHRRLHARLRQRRHLAAPDPQHHARGMGRRRDGPGGHPGRLHHGPGGATARQTSTRSLPK